MSEEKTGLPWYKHWAWRVIFQWIAMFFMIFFLVSPILSYMFMIGPMRMNPQEATSWMTLHLFLALIPFGVHFLRSFYHASGARYDWGFWFRDAEDNYWLRGCEKEKVEPLKFLEQKEQESTATLEFNGASAVATTTQEQQTQQLELSKGKIRTILGGQIELENYNPYVYYLKGIEDPLRIVLIPKPYTYETAVKEHRETVQAPYPIPSRVSLNAYTLLLEIETEYKGESIKLSIWELSFFAGKVERIQKGLPWMEVDPEIISESRKQDVERALLAWDVAYGTEMRLQRDAAIAMLKSVINQQDIWRDYGQVVATRLIEYFERTGEVPKIGLGVLNWFSRHKWKIVIAGAIVAGILIGWFGLKPWLFPQPITPP